MQHLYYLRFWLMQIQNAVSMRNEKMTQNNDIENSNTENMSKCVLTLVHKIISYICYRVSSGKGGIKPNLNESS